MGAYSHARMTEWAKNIVIEGPKTILAGGQF